jgi:uncharacterized protein (TIGR02452 family)
MSSSSHRTSLAAIAKETLDAIQHGAYVFEDKKYDLEFGVQRSKKTTNYYDPDSLLSTWNRQASGKEISPSASCTAFTISEISTLDGARILSSILYQVPASPERDGDAEHRIKTKIGILNFASAKKPGGGFLRGAQAQEESIARSSTLYPTLMTSTAQNFYTLHNKDPKGGFYSHAIIYSPDVLIIRDDRGVWIAPVQVDIITSPAVNAGVVRKNVKDNDKAGAGAEEAIEKAMKERMARILFLFETKGVRNIVLGSFGTGVFQNKVDLIGAIWADLLGSKRFAGSFDRVVFAVLGRKTYEEFKNAFEKRMSQVRKLASEAEQIVTPSGSSSPMPAL